MRVCFIGKMASGKSEAANLLKLLNKEKCLQKISFADPVKKIAREEFNMIEKDRKLLQIIGNTGRALDPNIWIKKLLQQLKTNFSYVVDDARFPNECIALKKFGFVLIYLNVNDQCRIKRLRQKYGTYAQQHIDNMTDQSENQCLRQYADQVWDNTSKTLLEKNINQLIFAIQDKKN